MADYDVGAVALVVPAKSSPRSTYRPAVSVRNNGIHDALASGYLRVYAAGLLTFETELYSGTITPGATGLAQATDYWTPESAGFYVIHAYLSTPLDQVESNNMLQPVTIEITGAAPPTPPVVTAHAAQHEEGGTDEVSIDGLQGRTADPQTPLAHAAQHQAGGSDALNVGSLQGVLAQDQPAQVHSNTRHNPVMCTKAEIVAHQGSNAVHTVATNLANRETTGPLTGLVPSAQLASGSEIGGTDDTLFLARYRTWKKIPNLGANAGPILVNPGPKTLLFLPVPAIWLSTETQILIESAVAINAHGAPGPTVSLSLLLNNLTLLPLDFSTPLTALIPAKIRASIIGGAGNTIYATLEILAEGNPAVALFSFSQEFNINLIDTDISITAEIVSGNPGDSLQQYSAFARALHQPA